MLGCFFIGAAFWPSALSMTGDSGAIYEVAVLWRVGEGNDLFQVLVGLGGAAGVAVASGGDVSS